MVNTSVNNCSVQNKDNNSARQRRKKTLATSAEMFDMYYYQENNYELAKTLSKEREENAQLAHFKSLYSSYSLVKQKYKCYVNQTQDVLGNLDRRVQLGLKHLASAMEVLVEAVGCIERQKEQNNSILQMEDNEPEPVEMNNSSSKTLMKVTPMVGGHPIKKASISLQRLVIPEAPETHTPANELVHRRRLPNIEEVDEAAVENNLYGNIASAADGSLINDTAADYSRVNEPAVNQSEMNVEEPGVLRGNDSSINTSECDVSIVRKFATYPTVCLERLRGYPQVCTESSAENVPNIQQQWSTNLVPSFVTAVNTRIPLVSLENCANTAVGSRALSKEVHKNNNGSNYLLVQSRDINNKLTPVVTLEDIGKTTFYASVMEFNRNSSLVPSDVGPSDPLVCLENCDNVDVNTLTLSKSTLKDSGCDSILSPKLTPVVTLEDISKSTLSSSIVYQQKRGRGVRQPKDKTIASVGGGDHSVLTDDQLQEKEPRPEWNSPLMVSDHSLYPRTDSQNESEVQHALPCGGDVCIPETFTPEVPMEVCVSRKRPSPEEEDPLEGPSWRYENMSSSFSRSMSYQKKKKKQNYFNLPYMFAYSSSDDSDSSSVLQMRQKKKKRLISPKKPYQRKCEAHSPTSEMGTTFKVTKNRAGLFHANSAKERKSEKKI